MMFLGRGMRRALTQRLTIGALMAVVVGAAAPLTHATDDEAQRALVTAHGLLERGLHELAAAEYESYLQLAPDGGDAATARYGLAVCRFRLEQWQAAVDALDGVPRDASFQFAGDALLIGGHALLRLGDAAGAAERFGVLVGSFAEHPSAGEAAAVRVEALQRAGEVAGASAAYDELATRWPDEALLPRAAFFAGQADMAQGQLDRAAGRFATCANRAEAGLAARATLMQARCLERTGRADAALDAFATARGALGDDALLQREAMLGQARLLYSKGQLEQAAEALDASLRDSPTDELAAHAGLLRARVYVDEDQPAAASKLLAPLMKAGPVALRDDATFWAAKCALRADKPGVAAELLEHAVGQFGQSELLAEMRYDLGVALTRAGQDEAAEQAFALFAERHSAHALAGEAWATLASLQHNRGAYEESFRSAESALGMAAPAQSEALRMLRAEDLLMLQRFEDAAQAFADVRKSASSSALQMQSAFRGAQALARAGQFAQARPLFESVLDGANTPRVFAPAAFELGDGLFASDDYAEAEHAFSLFIDLAPDDASIDDALIKLGLAQARQKHADEALKTFERLLKEYPQSTHATHARFEQGQALVALDRPADATRAFEAVVSEAPDSRFAPFAMRDLGALAQQRGDYEAARRWFERAAGTGVEAIAGESRYEEARSLLAAGRYAEAAPALEALLEQGDAAQRAACAAQLGLALSRVGQSAEALPYLERALERDQALAQDLRESAMYELAWCLRALERPESIDAYRTLLSAGPSPMVRGHALLDCAALLMDRGELADASELLGEANAIADSGDAVLGADVVEQIVYRRGACGYKLGSFEEAASTLAGFRARFPKSTVRSSAELIRGESLMRLNRHSDAAVMFAGAVDDETCRPQDKQAALLRLGETCATLQRWNDSRDAFERYLAQFGDEPLWFQAAFGKAWALEHSGMLDEAIESYRTVAEKHEGETAARAQFQIGECLFAKGDLAEAARELMRVDILYAYPQWSAAALHEAGKCFEQMRQIADARAQYEAVVRRFAESSWAQSARERLNTLEQANPPGRNRVGGDQ
ncbi:MAG: tetratricopeptide repeat protein [Phycisphaerales bacterium]|nr:tetratricopeptide repeat protein [Phycisphaerales bacterium]